jgi:hypothetical protein
MTIANMIHGRAASANPAVFAELAAYYRLKADEQERVGRWHSEAISRTLARARAVRYGYLARKYSRVAERADPTAAQNVGRVTRVGGSVRFTR